MIISWLIKPINTPAVIKNCSRCGDKCEFICSNNFRINANRKRLDVWLIYRCKECGSTWNMDIMSRTKPEDIDEKLYNGFLNNSVELAYKYAFDNAVLSRNRVKACYDNVLYTVEGEDLTPDIMTEGQLTLYIKPLYNMQIRLDKLISDRTGITRGALKELFKAGAVISDDFGFDPEKTNFRIKGDLTLRFVQPIILPTEISHI